jgi:recombinational DNA repair protein (RecF pathway)
LTVFLNEQGCLLRKAESGESHFLLVFFLRERGLRMTLMRKRSRSTQLAHEPDLFDSGDLVIEQKGESKPAFLKEFTPKLRFTDIARQYTALKAASRLTRFYEKNLFHMEHFETAWELLHTALDSFSKNNQPGITYLKALYVFAKSEGYPVREEWLGNQSPDNRSHINAIMRQPVGSIELESGQVDHWIRNLETYFMQSTDLIVPDG